MASTTQRIRSRSSRDVRRNKLSLSQANFRRLNVFVPEQLAERTAQRMLRQSLRVRAILDAGERKTDVFELSVGGRGYGVFEPLVKQRRMAKPVPCVVRGDGGIAEVIEGERHIVAVFLLPIRKCAPHESTQIRRLRTGTGERIIGRKVRPASVAKALDAGTSNPSTEGALILDLAEDLQLRGAFVIAMRRIGLTGFNGTMRNRLRVCALFSEIIWWDLSLFDPVDTTGPAIVNVLVRYPIACIADRVGA